MSLSFAVLCLACRIMIHIFRIQKEQNTDSGVSPHLWAGPPPLQRKPVPRGSFQELPADVRLILPFVSFFSLTPGPVILGRGGGSCVTPGSSDTHAPRLVLSHPPKSLLRSHREQSRAGHWSQEHVGSSPSAKRRLSRSARTWSDVRFVERRLVWREGCRLVSAHLVAAHA